MNDNIEISEGCESCSSNETKNSFARRVFNSFGLASIGLIPFKGLKSSNLDIIEESLEIKTLDGICDSSLFYPKEGKHPSALIWTDIRGLRESFKLMGRRLASEGYTVLIPNPFYRTSKAPAPREDFNYSNLEHRAVAFKMMKPLLADGAAEKDTSSFINFLQNHNSVDSSRPMGVSGYCMGGPLSIRSASVNNNLIKAVASFHGGGLITNNSNSPHLLIENINARFYIAIADNDDKRNPNLKIKLRKVFGDNKKRAEIEVYDNMNHGWCVSDSSVYNYSGSEIAWNNLIQMYSDEL